MSQQSEKDSRLVLKVLAGDERAFAQLMSSYRDSIYFLVNKMVNNPDDADDLTMEIFIKAYRNIDSYNPQYAFSTWLYRIAQNTAIDFIRKRKASLVPINYEIAGGESSISEDLLQSSALNPEESMIKEQDEILIKGLIGKMKPKYRVLIELRYFKDYAYEEIAQELNMPVGTVKTQLFRAKAQLGDLLTQKIINTKKESDDE